MITALTFVVVAAQTLNPQILQALSLLVGTVNPLLTAVLTKSNASPGFKAVVNGLLSAVTGVLVTVIGAAEIEWYQFVLNIVSAWVASIGTYYGLLKPTGTAQMVAKATKKVGVGKPKR